ALSRHVPPALGERGGPLGRIPGRRRPAAVRPPTIPPLRHHASSSTDPTRDPMPRKTKRRPGGGAIAAPIDAGREHGAGRGPVPARGRRTWLVAIPLVLLVVAAFLPVLGNDFVNWDDQVNFLGNPDFRGLGWPQVRWAWTTFLLGVYQPLAWLLLEAQYVVGGPDPRVYHLVSLLLHAATAVALYALTAALLARCRPDIFLHDPWARALGAGLATAVFAVHPLRVEAVAWASCQPYLPCALFSMLAVLAYLHAFPLGSQPRGCWPVGLFAPLLAALLSHAGAGGPPPGWLLFERSPPRPFGVRPC